MKYTILGFQQTKLIELDLKVDDALILRTVKDMYASASMEFIVENSEKYMWLNQKYFLSQIPIIGSRRTLLRRIDGMIEKGAITYARRYAISAILGISSEDDDDGNQAEKDSKGQRNNNSNLSDAQIKRLYAIGFSRGISKDTINRSIKQDYKKNNPANLTKKEYDELCNRLEKQPKKE